MERNRALRRRLCAIGFLGIVLLVGAVVFIFLKFVVRDTRPRYVEASQIQLKQIYETAILMIDRDSDVQSMNALHHILSAEKGGELLKWEVDRREDIALNPDIGKWRNRQDVPGDTAAVCPGKVEVDGRAVYPAIDFSGDFHFLDKLPSWAK